MLSYFWFVVTFPCATQRVIPFPTVGRAGDAQTRFANDRAESQEPTVLFQCNIRGFAFTLHPPKGVIWCT